MHLSDLDATAQAELVRSGEASPRELVDAAIVRIERDNPELGAVIIPLFDQARATADNALHGPFRGVPILIKDILATVGGVLQTGGLLPLKRAGYIAPFDSHLVATLRRAGFVIVGKTNTSELGIVPSAESPAWPPSRNPFDTARSTGGSSGGSACAVASGMVPIAHANDGGGSIRIPASCCGLFGLKPSRGRVSLAPQLGDGGGLVCEHVVARSVRDSAAVLDLLAGMQTGDPYTAPPKLGPYATELGVPPGRLKIAFATRHFALDGSLVESHPDCRAAVEETALMLEALGHHVEPAEIDAMNDPEWIPRFLSIWVVGVATEIAAAGRLIGRPIEQGEVETLTWGLSELGKLISGPAYADAWRWIHAASRRIAAFFEKFDLWLTPTVTEPPVPLGTFKSPVDDPLAGIFRAADFAPFTAIFNATGQPACSIPLHRNAAGLPIGVQLAAAYGREDLLLRVAAQLEAAHPLTHPATRH
ncbi:MAG: 6-aminohexanoate-cyclic-dimer hydrolase [Myxococcales bacterium]|nr:6-aminohexanoate-cyclic-dimer hydrolase [Myxococcales bacterium]